MGGGGTVRRSGVGDEDRSSRRPPVYPKTGSGTGGRSSGNGTAGMEGVSSCDVKGRSVKRDYGGSGGSLFGGGEGNAIIEG
ncbi:hypothetical protein HDU99_006628, partial [Rhizoclosmatium hyalinum]